MEIHQRKIQSFAKYSYAVTLPVHWVKKNGLVPSSKTQNKNSEPSLKEIDPVVNIFEMPDGSLQLYPSTKQKQTEEIIVLVDLDDLIQKNPNFIEDKAIQMLLISYYMNGAHGVEIISQHSIPRQFLEQIEKIQSRLLFNWNINRISSRKIIIKNIFSETPENIFQDDIPNYLRESFSILLWIIEDILTAIKERKYDDLTNITERDNKIDRYYFFCVRQIRTIFENPQISKPLNYSHKKLVDLRLLAKFIEDVGDILKNSASILYKWHTFIDEISLRDFLIEYFTALFDVYSQLSDYLRKSVAQRAPTVGMNEEIMNSITNYRSLGHQLELKWTNLAPTLPFPTGSYTLMDYYQGSRLIKNLEEIFTKVFDFTNLFF